MGSCLCDAYSMRCFGRTVGLKAIVTCQELTVTWGRLFGNLGHRRRGGAITVVRVKVFILTNVRLIL